MRLLIVLLISTLLVSCACFQSKCKTDGCDSEACGENSAETNYQMVNIPQVEHGYKYFEINRTIESEKQYNDFLKEVAAQEYWNNQEGFLNGLSEANIDFKTQNLILIPHTASPGSDKVSLSITQETPEKLVFNLDKVIPDGMRTWNMAYHCFAVVFDKNVVKEIEFNFDKKETIYKILE